MCTRAAAEIVLQQPEAHLAGCTPFQPVIFCGIHPYGLAAAFIDPLEAMEYN